MAMQGMHCMEVVAVFMGTLMGWHFQHMIETMTEAVATVLRHSLMDGGTITVNVHILTDRTMTTTAGMGLPLATKALK